MKFMLAALAVAAISGCATTSPATTAPGAGIVSVPTADNTRCTREPVKDWKPTQAPMGTEYRTSEGLAILVDISPMQKDGEEDGSAGYLLSVYSANHLGQGGWAYTYVPPHGNKPIERFIRCLRGQMEWAFDEWTKRPFSYTPAPTGKKGGK